MVHWTNSWRRWNKRKKFMKFSIFLLFSRMVNLNFFLLLSLSIFLCACNFGQMKDERCTWVLDGHLLWHLFMSAYVILAFPIFYGPSRFIIPKENKLKFKSCAHVCALSHSFCSIQFLCSLLASLLWLFVFLYFISFFSYLRFGRLAISFV